MLTLITNSHRKLDFSSVLSSQRNDSFSIRSMRFTLTKILKPTTIYDLIGFYFIYILSSTISCHFITSNQNKSLAMK